MPRVDRDAPLEFLRTAYEPDDWVAVFLKSYESGRVAQRVRPLSLVCDSRFQAWLRWRNLMRWNIFISVNAIVPGQRSRTRGSVGAVRHVFLDADRNGSQVLSTIDARGDLPPPSYVLHSSPNRIHVFWRASGFTSARVERLQRHLARELGTDSAATPCTQTTRLAGFFNHKPQYQTPPLVTLEYRNREALYTPDDFPTLAPPPRVNHERRLTPRMVTGDRMERARRYLAAVPPAVSGQHGDVHTFRICCRLVRGFALSDADALAVMSEWNARCEPPWADRELRDKLARARRYGREPMGGLVEAHL
jgi:hypothetical protein